jgi:hypothetical protein
MEIVRRQLGESRADRLLARNTPWKADLGKSYNYPVTNQPFAQIDYGSIIAEAPSSSVAALQCFLWDELPYVWLKTYKAMNIQPVNVHTMTISGFQYLFDHATELVTHGQLPPRDAPDDRLVAVQGRSRPVKRERPTVIGVCLEFGQITTPFSELRGWSCCSSPFFGHVDRHLAFLAPFNTS